jgi:hypothetical protein
MTEVRTFYRLGIRLLFNERQAHRSSEVPTMDIQGVPQFHHLKRDKTGFTL